jgi:hypothetical protein
VQKPTVPGASLTDAVQHTAGGGLPETITEEAAKRTSFMWRPWAGRKPLLGLCLLNGNTQRVKR